MLPHIIYAILLSSAIIPDVFAAPPPYHVRGTTKSRSSSTSPKAVYLITNDQQNAVAAIPIAADGTLAAGSLTLTGGSGSNAINGATNQPAAPDALVGQSALTIVGQYIFAVNPGSNSLSMFSIDASNPTELTLLGQPVDLPGEFPNTVAASAKHKIACVGTTGATNGVSCSSFSRSGLGEMDGLRSFDLNQTTPPVGPTNTVSQLFFSEDESRLFATVKGDPTVNNTGFFSVFPVDASSWGKAATVSTTDIRSSPNGTAVLFGSANIPGTSSVFVTDASFGGVVLDVDPATNEVSLVAKQAIDGQVATCWATISPLTNSAFVTDAGVDRVVEMSLANASIIAETDLSANGDPGLIDLKAAGNFVYALSPGNGTTPAAITVLDVSGGQRSAMPIQHFTLNGMGVDKNAQGMAVV